MRVCRVPGWMTITFEPRRPFVTVSDLISYVPGREAHLARRWRALFALCLLPVRLYGISRPERLAVALEVCGGRLFRVETTFVETG